MVTNIDNGIEISVEVFYQNDYSNPLQNEFMFAYRITLVNKSHKTVKLMQRHWDIFDSDGNYRIVEGEGVVGMQPILAPKDEFQYVSGCNLHSEMGVMSGFYEFEENYFKDKFYVKIPRFELIAPFKLN